MKGTLFALARNRNDIDANEKLKSMLYQVEATGAAFIDGKNILADSIFARHIQAGSITTEHMTAGSIKGDRIEVGTLNADRITAYTIKSNMIHTDGLDAGVIKTGVITAGNNVSVINMSTGEFSLGGGKLGYVAATDRLYVGANSLYLGQLPIEEHNRMLGGREAASAQRASVAGEKLATDARYAAIYYNVNLPDEAAKTSLYTAYAHATTGYVVKYTALITALDAVVDALPDTTIPGFATLQQTAADATSAYATSLASLTTALDTADKAIADKVAQDKADAAISSSTINTSNAITLSKQIKDTRETNQNPAWYISTYPRQTVEEFKLETTMGNPNQIGSYGVLTTIVPWANNSGGPIQQTFRVGSLVFQRSSTSDTAWSAWIQLEDKASAQSKVDSAIASATGKNKWIGKRYDTIDAAHMEPSFSAIKNYVLKESVEVSDALLFRFGTGTTENYIGHWSTNVYVTVAKNVSFSAVHDDGFAVYLNGKRLAGKSGSGTTPFTLALVAGWNQIDLLLHEKTGGDNITLNQTILSNVDQMSCYLGNNATTAEILDINNSLSTLNTTMNGSFKDGILTASEKSAITTQKNVFVSQKNELDSRYNSLRGKLNDLTLGTEKTALETAYGDANNRYTQKYNSLITALDAVINTADNTSSGALDTLTGNIDTAATNYTSELGLFSTALSVAEQAISAKLASNALDTANDNIDQTVPYSIVFSNENQSIPTDAVGVLKGSFIFGSDILVFRGSTRTSGTIGTVVLKDTDGIAVIATGGTISINVTQPTASITGKVEVLFSAGANLSAEMGYLDVPITVNGVIYNKRMTWNKARDGEASRSYNLVLNTLSLQGIPGGGYSPSIIEGNVSARLGTEPIMGESGYFLIYEQSRESMTMDEYNSLLENGQVAVDKEYIISDVMYPLVQRYASTIPETEFSYTPSENTSMVLIAIYADSGFTNLLDYQSVPIIYEGQNAYGMQLTATNGLVFKFDQFNANRGMADTVLTPILTNITDATYAWKLNGSATVSATTPTVTVGYSALNNVDSIKYLCEVTGVANGVSITVSDTVTVSKVKDGSDTYNIILTNESVNIPTAADGTSPVLTGANTNVKLYYGTVEKAPTLSLSSQTGGTATIDTVDTTKVSIATVTADAGYIDILVKDGTTTVGTKRFSFARSKQGISGRSITAVDVEYYLSTSNTAQADGNWSTTAPAWTSGKYMWSRTKTTYSTGSPTYSNPACITGTAGQTGGTGTGITSITEEFYLSTSKTTQTGSSWGTAMPTWIPNTYMWTRSKIVYSNPTSTVYTTPLVDSSWEAVNEIKVGGRNLVKESGISVTNTSYALKTLPYGDKWLEAGKQYTITAKFTLGADRTSLAFYSSGGYANPVSMTNAERNADGICSKTFIMSYSAGRTPAEGYTQLIAYQMQQSGTTASTLNWVKVEEGNKATDWTPAPEDVTAQIETKSKTFTSTPVPP